MSITLPSLAGNWINASDIPGVRYATQDEKQWIAKEISGYMIADDFKNSDFLFYDGDLTVPTNLEVDKRLVVRGNLTINGMYDDFEDFIGSTIVFGNMSAENMFNIRSLRVTGDLNVTNIMFTGHDHYYFSVDGTLNAKGVIVDDKLAEFNLGKVEFAFLGNVYDEDSEEHEQLMHNGFRSIRPELISMPDIRDYISETETLDEQSIEGPLREYMMAGESALRETPAPEDLPLWLEAVLNMETSEKDLLLLINKDPLVNLLMASREELPRKARKALMETKDPMVINLLNDDF